MSRNKTWLVAAGVGVAGVVLGWIWFSPTPTDPDGQTPGQPPYGHSSAGAVLGPRPEVAALIAEAAGVCDRLVERFPHSPPSHDVKAWFLYRFGKSAEAVQHWQRCIELDSTFGAAYYWMGRCAFDQEDYGRAVEYFRKSLAVEPDSAIYPLYLANALMRLAKFEEAVAVLREDVKARPNAMASYVLLGQGYLHLRRYQEAKENLEKAIVLAPDYTSAYYTLATACDRLGEKDKAKQYHARFRRLKERDQREEREALKRHDDTAEVRQGVARVYSMAARVYEANGETAEAQSHQRRAAELDPSNAQDLQTRKPREEKVADGMALPGL
jgi:tetratricopeptide (TPR) repeat protein